MPEQEQDVHAGAAAAANVAEAAPQPSPPPRPRVTLDAPSDTDRTYSTFQHLIGVMGLFGGGLPIMGLIGAIAMWRIKAKQSEYLDDHGREAVNFQVSLMLYGLVMTIPTLGFVWFLIAGLSIFGCVRGAMAANRGEYYRYPVCLRLIGAPGA